MRFLLSLWIVFFLAFRGYCQIADPCPNGLIFPTDFCQQACVVCGFDGYFGSTDGYSSQTPPGGFCGTIENEQWIAFIAGGSQVTITVTSSNCIMGNGIQLAVYPDCQEAPIACNGGNNGWADKPLSVTVNLIPGKTYFLLIDGFAGDICDFTVEITPPISVTAPPVGLTGAITGPNTVCPGATALYNVPQVSGAGYYIWSGGPNVLFNGSPSPYYGAAPDGRSVLVTFNGAGSSQICVEAANSCNTGSTSCKNIAVQPIPITVIPPVNVCFEDTPYELPWGNLAFSSGNYVTTLTSWQGCDSIVRQQVTIKPPIVKNLGSFFLCPGDCLTVCGTDYCDQGSYSVTCDSYLGCDSTNNFTIINALLGSLGYVFWDTDGNEKYNGADYFAPNITVQLIRTNGTVINLTTNASGRYTTSIAAPGDTLRIILPPGAISATPLEYVIPSSPSCLNFALQFPAGEATGIAFFDDNDNGIFDAGELPAPGLSVTASGAGSTFTAADGSYSFASLQPGAQITLQSPGGIYSVTPVFHTFLGNQSSGYDFAIQKIKYEITGIVYYDGNENGVLDPNDSRAGGVTVFLSSGATTQTDFSGVYKFSGLIAADTIFVVLPANALGVTPGYYVILPGQPSGYDFALTPGPNSAQGLVFFDVNNNGIYNTGIDTKAIGAKVNTSGGLTTTAGLSGYYFASVPNGDTIRVMDQITNPPFHITIYPQAVYNFPIPPGPGPANGIVYYDLNNNNIFNPGIDQPAGGITVFVGFNQAVPTDASGYYSLPQVNPGDSIRISLPNNAISVFPPFLIYNFGIQNGYNFALKVPPTHDLSVDMVFGGPFVPGLNTTINLFVENKLNMISNVEVCMVLSPLVNYIQALPLPTSISGDTLCWELGTMGIGTDTSIQVIIQTDPSTPVATTMKFSARVEPIFGDIYPEDNVLTRLAWPVAPFDPNRKEVDVRYLTEDMLGKEPPLQYTIQFQNTGDEDAQNVVILDTLSTKLILSTFKFIGASHTCNWSIRPGRILEIKFPNIILPPVSEDFYGSMGFASFSVKPVSNLSFGQSITNFADIYFDFNDPIRTDTAVTQVVYFLPNPEFPPANNRISARPNPASFKLRVSWDQPASQDAWLYLFSSLGLPVFEQQMAPGTNGYDMDVSFLDPGVYYLVFQDGGNKYSKVVVIAPSGPVKKE